MRCLAVCQTELAIRMLDEVLLPNFEIEFLVEGKPLAKRLHDSGLNVSAGDPRRTDTYIKADLTPGTCVVVEDDGPGIPADVQPRIFEPFFTTKGVGEGTGLGLDIARRIVEKHHGRIQFESRPGRTAFQVRLPLNQPKTVNQGVENAAGLQSH